MVLAAVAFAGILAVTVPVGPACAAPASPAPTSASASTDNVVGTQSQVPVQLVMRGGGGGHGGGGHAFAGRGFSGRSFGGRSFAGRGFRGGRFYGRRFYGRRFYGGGFYGGIYSPYYGDYDNDCYWDGYQWICPDDF